MADRLLTIQDAAARVKRSRPTIERWIRDGDLAIAVSEVDRQGRRTKRYVLEADLLAALRKALKADPTRRRARHDDTPS